MRAIVYAEKGPSSVMRLVDRPVPAPGPGQVRVRMVRAGVNPTDWKARAGVSAPMGFAEVTPGQDGAGVIDALGAGVPGLAAGDRVWLYLGQHGLPYGTAAEYCVLDWHRVVRLPDSLAGDEAFDLGACLGVPAITAHRALTSGPRNSRLGPDSMTGQLVLVQGGAGAVGNAAIQLAAWSGATVITTVSSDEKAAIARAHGCDHVIVYTREDFPARVLAITGGKKVPVVYDSVGKDTFLQSLDCLAPRGLMVSFGNASGPVDSFNPGILGAKGSLYLTRPSLGTYGARREELVGMASELFEVVRSGAVKIEVHQTYPLREAVRAHRDLEGRRTTGSTVLTV